MEVLKQKLNNILSEMLWWGGINNLKPPKFYRTTSLLTFSYFQESKERGTNILEASTKWQLPSLQCEEFGYPQLVLEILILF